MKYKIKEVITKEQTDEWEYETDMSKKELLETLKNDTYFKPGEKINSHTSEIKRHFEITCC